MFNEKPNEAITQPEGWNVTLQLDFDLRDAQTRMVRCCHKGPLRVQKPFFYPESNECHVYILHPPGGFVGNDREFGILDPLSLISAES